MKKSTNNRLDSFARGLVESLFKDVSYKYTSMRELRRDRLRLLSQISSRGLGSLLNELPALGKHFDKCLDGGLFTHSSLVLSRPKKKGEVVPLFMRQLFLQVFTASGELLERPCVDSILAIRTLLTTWKTLRLPCSKEAVADEVNNFFRLDASLRNPNLRWDCDDLGEEDDDILNDRVRSLHLRDLAPADGPLFETESSLSSGEWDHLQRCFDIAASQLGLAPHLCGDNARVDYRPRNGPGVVAEMPAGRSKYEFPNWPLKLQRIYPHDEFALPSFGWGFSHDRESTRGLNREVPSRLIAVPKTLAKPRLIAAEPQEYQWIQQHLWKVLEARVSNSYIGNSIRFRDQSFNGDWALEGSLTGRRATIDLSEASDRLTCAVVERFFRRNIGWLIALHSCRTRMISYREPSGVMRYAKLRKYSTMGSTVIFPLQSIIYATIAIAATLWSKQEQPTIASMKIHSHSVRCFGDDIIVNAEALVYTARFLEAVGLKVNQTKTFSGRNFRESCGVDAFRGVNVTPPRLRGIPDGTPGTAPSLVETSNNFYKAGFWHTCWYVRDLLKKWHHVIPWAGTFDVPFTESRTAVPLTLGFLSYSPSGETHLRCRWNPDWQAKEFRVMQLSNSVKEGAMSASARLLQYFTEDPDPLIKWKSGFALSRSQKMRPGWVAL